MNRRELLGLSLAAVGGIFAPRFGRWYRRGSGLVVPTWAPFAPGSVTVTGAASVSIAGEVWIEYRTDDGPWQPLGPATPTRDGGYTFMLPANAIPRGMVAARSRVCL